MTPHSLRPYQTQAITDLRRSIARGNKRVVLQLATGAGKTLIASEIIRSAVEKKKKVLFLAPRRELIYQAEGAFRRHGVRTGIIMAGERAMPLIDVQIASFDTLHARAIRTERMALPDADVLLVDEGHLSISDSRKEIIQAYPDAVVVALTATPARGDGRGLGEIYQDIVFGPTIRDLTDQEHLVPLRYFAPTMPDLSKLRLNSDGDYAEKGLAKRMNTPKLIGDIVDNWLRIAPDRRTVVFCVDCAHSRGVRNMFLAAGIAAEHVDGETPLDERADIFDRVKSGETRVLCNVFVASYGLDIPALDCAVLARPTKNITLYLQTIGRIMRPFTEKLDGIVIDHAGAVKENGFADDFVPWSLDGETTVKDRKKAAQIEAGAPKEIKCEACHRVFKGARICPFCGHQCIGPTKAIPVHEAKLEEVKRAAERHNRDMTMEQKCQFIGELRGYARIHNHQDGWIAHKYRAYTSAWPNDARLKEAPMRTPSRETESWLKSQNIRWAKSKDNNANG